MTAPELKPCPFCGGKAEVWTTAAYSADSAEHVIGCKACEVYMPFANVFSSRTPDAVYIAAWNTRATPLSAALAVPDDADLRKRLTRAIADPGAKEGYKGDRSLTQWQVDAVIRALRAVEGRGDE